jgi:hypothetical protein
MNNLQPLMFRSEAVVNNFFTTVARDSAPRARHLARIATFSPFTTCDRGEHLAKK